MIRFINGIPITPIAYVQYWSPSDYNPNACKYTKEGRLYIHNNLNLDFKMLEHLMLTDSNESIQYIDNRIALYSAQKGKCAITGAVLTKENIHCHHKTPRKFGGTDEYDNLMLVTELVHILIHSTNKDTIEEYKKQLKLNNAQINKINKLRELLLLGKIN